MSPILKYFTWKHLPSKEARQASEVCSIAAEHMENALPDGAEKSAGLRKLLEAKDCFVRAALEPKQEPKPESWYSP